jgi:outer membrane murein-binding lipoprotein Lpp
MDVTTIGIICTIVGAVIGISTYKRTVTKDIQNETKESAIMATKLDFISQGVNNIQVKMEAQETKFEAMNERITRVEESTKSAHKRLDDIEKEGM